MAVTPGAHGVVNLATGVARPVSDVIRVVEAATGRNLDATVEEIDEPYEGSCADTAALEAALRWKPSRMLEDGVARLVAFERDRRAGAVG